MLALNNFQIRLVLVLVANFLLANVAHATFYQSTTMAEYCREYSKFIAIEKSVSQYEAGICAGFVASTIELMDLSERLCKRDELNLDSVVEKYINQVESSDEAKKNSATFVLVDVLQSSHACE